MFKVWQWIDKNTHIAKDVMEKRRTGLEWSSCNAELRVLLQAVLEAGTRYMQCQFPSYIPRAVSSGVLITESGAFGCFLEHLGSSELQKQMSNIPNSQRSH